MSFKHKLTDQAKFGCQPAPARGKFNAVGFVVSALAWVFVAAVCTLALYVCVMVWSYAQ